jgi:hypothetical protein
MKITIQKSDEPDRRFAPFDLLADNKVILRGLESREEAQSILDGLRHFKAKKPPPPKPPRFLPKKIDGWKLLSTRKFLSQLPKNQRGSVLLEFALCLPVLLLLILGGLDLSLLASAKSSTNYIATTTAACLARTPANCASPQSYAQSLAQGLGLYGTIAASGSYQALTVTYQWSPCSPFFSAATLTATASAIQ